MSMRNCRLATRIGGVPISLPVREQLVSAARFSDCCHVTTTKKPLDVLGDYFRVLLPGEYSITCSKTGYLPTTFTAVIPEGQKKQIVVDVELQRQKQ
jgi:hypothetical protein